MNYSIIFKMLSMALGIMALAFSVCAGVSFFYSDMPLEGEAMPSWICSIAFSALLAFAFYLPSRNAPSKLFKKEAMCIVGLSWILMSLVGAFPYVLILDCPFSYAFFEASSGFTTTGASCFGSFAEFPRSLLFWRGLTNWIGGLGVLVFFVAILSFLGCGGRILYAREASTTSGGGLETERIQSGAMKILVVYAVISVACVVTFRICGMGWFDGICHMFATVATGGLSVYEDSIAHYNSALIDWAVILFMFIGGVSFTIPLMIAGRTFGRLARNTEFWTYTILAAAVSVAVSILIYPQMKGANPMFEAFTQGTFQTVSIMTTTGLCSMDYHSWVPGALVLLFAMMIIGGCSGSTSGGIKVSRFIISIRLSLREIEKSFRPRVVRNISINGKILGEDDNSEILSFVVLYALISLGAFTLLSMFEPEMSVIGSISAVITCIGNVGPGFAEVGPDRNYGFLSHESKILLAMIMIMGRLEFYAILALFMPSLWRKFQ